MNGDDRGGSLCSGRSSGRTSGRSERSRLAFSDRRQRASTHILERKDRVREALRKSDHNVFQYYKTVGYCQAIVRSGLFQAITLAVIAGNAVWIGIDLDHNKEKVLIRADPVFQVAEHVFCAFFTFELCVRFMAFTHKTSCVRDRWFVFDGALVLLMILETWVMSIALYSYQDTATIDAISNASILRLTRLLRLTRIARMGRVIRAVPELMAMVKGMVAVTRSVMVSLGFLGIILYVAAVIHQQLLEGTQVGNEYFEHLRNGMYWLLMAGIFLDSPTKLATGIFRENYLAGLMFFMFVLISSLTVMNMMIGVIVQVMTDIAASDQEELLVAHVKSTLHPLLVGMDKSADDMISKDDFLDCLEHRDAALTLSDAGIDVVNLIDFTDGLFSNFAQQEGNREKIASHERKTRLSVESSYSNICKCGGQFPNNSVFCSACGERRSKDLAKRVCICGNVLKCDSQFCRGCGERCLGDDELGMFVTYNELIDEVLRLRSSNTATVKDIADLQKVWTREFTDLHRHLECSISRFDSLERVANPFQPEARSARLGLHSLALSNDHAADVCMSSNGVSVDGRESRKGAQSCAVSWQLPGQLQRPSLRSSARLALPTTVVAGAADFEGAGVGDVEPRPPCGSPPCRGTCADAPVCPRVQSNAYAPISASSADTHIQMQKRSQDSACTPNGPDAQQPFSCSILCADVSF